MAVPIVSTSTTLKKIGVVVLTVAALFVTMQFGTSKVRTIQSFVSFLFHVELALIVTLDLTLSLYFLTAAILYARQSLHS
jgi:hypothetical protein